MPHQNKRAHPRTSFEAQGWIAVPPGDNWAPLHTMDVSTGGFAFVGQEAIEVGSNRQFRLQLPNDAGVMHVEGRIAYCLELSATGGYRIGVQALTADVVDIAATLTRPAMPQPDPKRDLVLTRSVDVTREEVWAAWTTPALLKPWFCPRPWQTVECDIDLRPGGTFRTVMQGPNGERVDNIGTYLEVIENERLIWTNALLPGFRPAVASTPVDASLDFKFTAVITLEAQGNATRYTAMVLHNDEESRKKHEAMGFHQGWSMALDQLVTMVKAGS